MSILRPRQKTFVERSCTALITHGNTLSIAPTGFGKSRCLSAVIEKMISHKSERACVLAHRDELVNQNREQLHRYLSGASRNMTTTVVNATEKSWDGQVIYAMVPSLTRDRYLKQIPPLDLLIIDEAHHAVAPSYLKIIDRAKKLNPDVKIYGVTASAVRGDGKGLIKVFSNVADQVNIGEVIRDGHLVPPKTYIIDLGLKKALKEIDDKSKDNDMDAVSAIMNHQVVNESVVEHWKEKAGDRKTIVFCSNLQHAHDVCQTFVNADIQAAVIDGAMSRFERQKTIEAFDQGDLQVLVNCVVLTEGFDSQPVSCVVLLRPSSYKSTFIQCVGRGLRIVDPNLYPGVKKTDCIILDFGTSSLIHGTLEQEAILESRKPQTVTKSCPEGESTVPANSDECPLCSYIWPILEKQESCEKRNEEHDEENKITLKDFVMSEFDLLNRSPFQWCDIFGQDDTLIATGFHAWAGLFCWRDQWVTLGGRRKQSAKVLQVGERLLCLAAADDWLNEHETEQAATKSKRWLQQPVTSQQLQFLPLRFRMDYSLSRYHASCLLVFYFNKKSIQTLVMDAIQHTEVA